MTPPKITLASGRQVELPLFDPLVAAHFSYASSYVDTLLDQINNAKIYAPLFAGKKDLVFLDIGANIGLVSIYAADSCKRIVAVEPAPETFNVLKCMTHSFPNIEPVCAALAPQDGPHEFFVNDINSTASSTVNTYGKRIEVQGLTLSSILRIHQLEHVDVVKVDAEGGEGESLSLEELKAASPIVKAWFIEIHNCPRSSWNYKLGEIVKHLSWLGYYGMVIDGMTLIARRP